VSDIVLERIIASGFFSFLFRSSLLLSTLFDFDGTNSVRTDPSFGAYATSTRSHQEVAVITYFLYVSMAYDCQELSVPECP
jgi:hypothetical protein